MYISSHVVGRLLSPLDVKSVCWPSLCLSVFASFKNNRIYPSVDTETSEISKFMHSMILRHPENKATQLNVVLAEMDS